MFDYRNAYNELLRGRARQEEINEIIREEIRNGHLCALEPKYEYYENYIGKNIESDTMLINLHDLHFDLHLKPPQSLDSITLSYILTFFQHYNKKYFIKDINLYYRAIKIFLYNI